MARPTDTGAIEQLVCREEIGAADLRRLLDPYRAPRLESLPALDRSRAFPGRPRPSYAEPHVA